MTRTLAWIATLVLGAGAALWMALLNGAPLVPLNDSATYLAEAQDLARHGLRPPWYGVLAVYLWGPLGGTWGILGFQSALTALLTWRLMAHVGGVRETEFLLLYFTLALTTGMSFYQSSLLPDALGACLCLAAALLAVADSPRERALATAVLCLALVSHVTFLALGLGLWGCAALYANRRSSSLAPALRWGGGSLIFAFVFLVGANALRGREAVVVETSAPYLLTKAKNTGVLFRYLERTCSFQPHPLCPYREQLQRHSPHPVWRPESPAQATGGPLAPHLGELARNAILSEPLHFLWAHLGVSLRQALSFDLPGLPKGTTTLHRGFERALRPHFETEIPRYRHSLQARARFPSLVPLSLIQRVLVVLSLGTLLGSLWGRKPSRPLKYTLGALALSLALNALICGGSGQYGYEKRYQGRLVWLLPLAAYLSLRERQREGRRRRQFVSRTPNGVPSTASPDGRWTFPPTPSGFPTFDLR